MGLLSTEIIDKGQDFQIPPFDITPNGPVISMCTSCKGLRALHEFPTGKLFLCCLPIIHPSNILFGWFISGNPFTIFVFHNSFNPLNPRCPKRRCHSQELSFKMALKHFTESVLILRVNSLFLDMSTFAMTSFSLFLIVRARSLRLISYLFSTSSRQVFLLFPLQSVPLPWTQNKPYKLELLNQL